MFKTLENSVPVLGAETVAAGDEEATAVSGQYENR